MSKHGENEGVFVVSLRVAACANGETYEYQLQIGGERVGPPMFATGIPTSERKRRALGALLRRANDW